MDLYGEWPENSIWWLTVSSVLFLTVACFMFSIQHVETISKISNELYKDDGKGKKTFAVPTIDQVNTIISNSAPIVNGLQDIVNFANGKKEKFPELSTMPIKQYDVDKLDGDVEKVKKLPYAWTSFTSVAVDATLAVETIRNADCPML